MGQQCDGMTYGEAHGVGHVRSVATVEIFLLNLNVSRMKAFNILMSNPLFDANVFNDFCNKDTSSISAVRVISWSVNCPHATYNIDILARHIS